MKLYLNIQHFWKWFRYKQKYKWNVLSKFLHKILHKMSKTKVKTVAHILTF